MIFRACHTGEGIDVHLLSKFRHDPNYNLDVLYDALELQTVHDSWADAAWRNAGGCE